MWGKQKEMVLSTPAPSLGSQRQRMGRHPKIQSSQVFEVPTTTRRGHVPGLLPKEIEILVCPPSDGLWIGPRCPDSPPGPGWDADVWAAPHNQEETPVSGVPPEATGGTLASRQSPHNQKRT